MTIRRFVFDTGVLISAALLPRSIAYDQRQPAAARAAHRKRMERWIRNRLALIGPGTPLLAPPLRA